MPSPSTSRRFSTLHGLTSALAALLACAQAQTPVTTLPAAPAPQARASTPKPSEWCEISKVVDGDTLYVMRGGKEEKLRLLCVDTEEKIRGGAFDPDKPETVYGQETAVWAQEFFASLGQEGKPARVGLLFPGGREQRDFYGRMLCQVVLPDGSDYDLKLVREGRSPYFNKYGNSELCHAAFVEAQAEAHAQKLGIWNPETNAPKTLGAPSARRPYERLLPWWDARAAAIDGFRARRAAGEQGLFDADDPAELERALKWSSEGSREVEFFGCVDQVYEEKNGDQTVLFRGTDRKQLLRTLLPSASRAALASLKLELRGQEYRQNYVYVRGLPRKGERGGVELSTGDPKQWKLGGPEHEAEAPAKTAPAQPVK